MKKRVYAPISSNSKEELKDQKQQAGTHTKDQVLEMARAQADCTDYSLWARTVDHRTQLLQQRDSNICTYTSSKDDNKGEKYFEEEVMFIAEKGRQLPKNVTAILSHFINVPPQNLNSRSIQKALKDAGILNFSVVDLMNGGADNWTRVCNYLKERRKKRNQKADSKQQQTIAKIQQQQSHQNSNEHNCGTFRKRPQMQLEGDADVSESDSEMDYRVPASEQYEAVDDAKKNSLLPVAVNADNPQKRKWPNPRPNKFNLRFGEHGYQRNHLYHGKCFCDDLNPSENGPDLWNFPTYDVEYRWHQKNIVQSFINQFKYVSNHSQVLTDFIRKAVNKNDTTLHSLKEENRQLKEELEKHVTMIEVAKQAEQRALLYFDDMQIHCNLRWWITSTRQRTQANFKELLQHPRKAILKCEVYLQLIAGVNDHKFLSQLLFDVAIFCREIIKGRRFLKRNKFNRRWHNYTECVDKYCTGFSEYSVKTITETAKNLISSHRHGEYNEEAQRALDYYSRVKDDWTVDDPAPDLPNVELLNLANSRDVLALGQGDHYGYADDNWNWAQDRLEFLEEALERDQNQGDRAMTLERYLQFQETSFSGRFFQCAIDSACDVHNLGHFDPNNENKVCGPHTPMLKYRCKCKYLPDICKSCVSRCFATNNQCPMCRSVPLTEEEHNEEQRRQQAQQLQEKKQEQAVLVLLSDGGQVHTVNTQEILNQVVGGALQEQQVNNADEVVINKNQNELTQNSENLSNIAQNTSFNIASQSELCSLPVSSDESESEK